MPSLIGRRLTVYDIVTKLYLEDSIETALEDYEIDVLQAEAALEYCVNLYCQMDKKRINFCDGCVLRTIEEGWTFSKNDYMDISNDLTISKTDVGLYSWVI